MKQRNILIKLIYAKYGIWRNLNKKKDDILENEKHVNYNIVRNEAKWDKYVMVKAWKHPLSGLNM